MRDCSTGEDEDDVFCQCNPCELDEFVCDSGQCIPSSWACDNAPDCLDGSDEHDQCGKFLGYLYNVIS